VFRFFEEKCKKNCRRRSRCDVKREKVSVPTKTWKIIVFLLKVIPNSVFSLISGLLAPGRYDDV
jgi:hypothetical protein